MCQKTHGAAFATYAILSRRRFRLTNGAESVRSYRSSQHVLREFCGTCGSRLFWIRDEYPDEISVALGTIDGDPGGRPQAHIFAASRACWDEITDALPQYDEDLPP